MFAVLHVADFALQALLRAEPASEARKPVALLDPHGRPARLVACTAAARARGVEAGQTSAQALARCETLRLLPPRPAAESEARAGLLAAAFSLSPHVEATAPGVCTIQISGLAPALRETALRDALARLAELGLTATAGAGSTPLLALYAARHAAIQGDLIFIPDNERAFLAGLPLSAADPPPELTPILASWGLRTLGDLADLSKAAVTQRLGPSGLALWERAAGQTTRPLQVVAPAPEFSAAMDFEHELETLEPLLFLARRFVDRLALEVQNAALAAAEIVLTLLLADDTRHVRALKLPEPSARADVLFGAVQTYLETLRTPAGVVGLRIDLTPIRAGARQSGLFDRALRDPHRFAETLARVAALVGADRVGTPELQNTHRPDAFELVAPPSEIAPPPPAVFRHPPQGLVLRRHRPPRRVFVELHPESRRPLSLRGENLEGVVVACAGPFSASGEWWQADSHWWREEWDVELAEGLGLHRLIRTAAGWLIEGEYD